MTASREHQLCKDGCMHPMETQSTLDMWKREIWTFHVSSLGSPNWMHASISMLVVLNMIYIPLRESPSFRMLVIKNLKFESKPAQGHEFKPKGWHTILAIILQMCGWAAVSQLWCGLMRDGIYPLPSIHLVKKIKIKNSCIIYVLAPLDFLFYIAISSRRNLSHLPNFGLGLDN